VDIAPREIAPEAQEKIDERMKMTAIQMLSVFIADKELKNKCHLLQYRKAQKMSPDVRGDSKAEATYYLDEANYEFTEARDQYLADLQVELDLAKKHNAQRAIQD
jgi:hypothetical protein